MKSLWHVIWNWLNNIRAVSRAEFAISAVFVFVFSTIGGAVGFPEWLAGATNQSGIVAELGSNISLWFFGALVAGILLFMVKRNRQQ